MISLLGWVLLGLLTSLYLPLYNDKVGISNLFSEIVFGIIQSFRSVFLLGKITDKFRPFQDVHSLPRNGAN